MRTPAKKQYIAGALSKWSYRFHESSGWLNFGYGTSSATQITKTSVPANNASKLIRHRISETSGQVTQIIHTPTTHLAR